MSKLLIGAADDLFFCHLWRSVEERPGCSWRMRVLRLVGSTETALRFFNMWSNNLCGSGMIDPQKTGWQSTRFVAGNGSGNAVLAGAANTAAAFTDGWVGGVGGGGGLCLCGAIFTPPTTGIRQTLINWEECKQGGGEGRRGRHHSPCLLHPPPPPHFVKGWIPSFPEGSSFGGGTFPQLPM